MMKASGLIRLICIPSRKLNCQHDISKIFVVRNSKRSMTTALHDEDQSTIETELLADTEWSQNAENKKLISSFLYHQPNTSINEFKSMSEYLTIRNATHATNIQESKSALRFISSLLTFPLTLSYTAKKVFPYPIPNLRVLVIGARSEFSLPDVWWNECLFSSESSFNNITISMLGPDIDLKHLANRGSDTSPSIRNYEWLNQKLSLVDISNPKNHFHNHPNVETLLRDHDLFILYNSGMGSDALKQQWDASLRLLLETKKPIIATSHSRRDFERDFEALERIALSEDWQDLGDPIDIIIPPHINPYASHKRTFDRLEEPAARIVTTNQYLFAVQSK